MCGKEFDVNIRTNIKKIKCLNCQKLYRLNEYQRKKRPCKLCGQLKCLRKDICKKGRLFTTLVKYFGFDETKIGTIEVYSEFDRVRDLLYKDYWESGLSTSDLIQKYTYPDIGNLGFVLTSLNIKRRTVTAGMIEAYIHGKMHQTKSQYPYKSCWYTTWNSKNVFLRSSYALDYAKQLDEQKIDYDVESLRIIYWNSQLQRQAVAIPDFYLRDTNTVVEIKSTYTYNEQEMKDKFEAYKKHGYKCKLILEGSEV